MYASNIHGIGLFCKREISPGEMVIEYTGEEIRAGLTDYRERYYESKVGGTLSRLCRFSGFYKDENRAGLTDHKEK